MSTVREFGAAGDGRTDDTAAIMHAIKTGNGHVQFPRGEYLITKPLSIPLDLYGRVSLEGAGCTTKLLMAGAGPAIHLVGTHQKSALPDHFKEAVWRKERLPTVSNLEIEGRHPEADGVRIKGTMQPTLQGLLIRHCRHGVHLVNRDRNVLISDCHIYNNSGAGIFLDHVNLHQINIHGNHISYCKQGGIRVVGSELRNIQICSNDIEYNYDLEMNESADVLFDCREGTVREGTIVGNTIQSVESLGGAAIRLLGAGKDQRNALGLLAITGNLLGSQHTILHLKSCRGIVVSGNCFYSGYENALLAEDVEHLVFSGNSIDYNPEYRGRSTDRLILRGCRHVNVQGLLLQHTREVGVEPEASMEVSYSENVNITGCQIVNARTRGLQIKSCKVVRVADSTITGRPDDKGYRAAIDVDEPSSQVLVKDNFLSRGSEGALLLPETSGRENGNIVLE